MENLARYITNLARNAVQEYVINGKKCDIPAELPKKMYERAGVFVTLKKEGNLRGCIGTFRPVQKNLAEEIVSNAISAADSDPRFPGVDVSELDEIEISVDVLSEPEKIKSRNELDPKKYGILVKGGHQTGLLLPDLEGVDTVAKQIEIARRKAGIQGDKSLEIFKFVVERYHENG